MQRGHVPNPEQIRTGYRSVQDAATPGNTLGVDNDLGKGRAKVRDTEAQPDQHHRQERDCRRQAPALRREAVDDFQHNQGENAAEQIGSIDDLRTACRGTAHGSRAWL